MNVRAIAHHHAPAEPPAHPDPDILSDLAQAFNQILDTPPPTERPALGHLTVDQLDERIADAFDRIAGWALRLATEHGVTGDEADQAVAEFLQRVRIRLEARMAEDYLRLRAQHT